MKTMIKFSVIAAAAFLVLTFTGCKKGWYDVPKSPNEEIKICNIKKVIEPEREWKEAVFSYNSFGNPTKIILKKVLEGNTNFVFKYDKWNRLTAYAGIYGDSFASVGASFGHRYIYRNDGTVLDSSYTYNTYIDENGEFSLSDVGQVSIHEFDNKGRISKTLILNNWYVTDTIERETFFPPITRTFNYDNKGNKIILEDGAPAAYSDKINILRTNKVFMFVNNDYSVNSLTSFGTYIGAYNCYGLPLKASYSGGIFHGGMQLFDGRMQIFNSPTSSVEYMCDCNAGSSK